MAMTLTANLLEESRHYGDSLFRALSEKESLKTFLFGYPISHSLAPILHSTIWDRLNMTWTYSFVESLDKKDFLPSLGSPEFVGAAVTMPHKISMMENVDDLTESAQMIGAINTIFVRCDKRGNRQNIGANTDTIGIYEAFERNFPGSSKEIGTHSGLIVGSGGACRSAIYALWKHFHVQEIYLVNRATEEVENVISWMLDAGMTPMITHIQTVEEAKACSGVSSIIGTIPDIPPKTAAEIVVQQIVTEFLHKEKKGYLMDMCYFPHPLTRLIRSGLESGWTVIPGIEPLIYQGIAQQALWLEREVDDSVAVDAAQRVRHRCGIQSSDLLNANGVARGPKF
ncbi:uncharacterized protein Z518_05725 [Rhinocladiella mackenziei CBS 650.93]|uniref:Shikimate dehydrogenase substrate binding N-terminal domain-containing protein n=1 Tax=Rhinocladiella mackenziei CBS 650.93 TaxID=1442369 RepID=A0A0D2IGE6_9EURO|nr:uncharacterized protein Z518_05725 [Rhinocladiella mackenziei CBS 650.93]KIX04854.1 hypothetical protein Z518_05725 [Rhinocladiella mackenziei CBS 650.93]